VDYAVALRGARDKRVSRNACGEVSA
jgi:hypothetical protein